jgi:serpin B
MRTLGWLILVSVICLGCDSAEEARRRAAVNHLRQMGMALKNYHETHQKPLSPPTHVIIAETEYYTDGPQQSRPPDGRFPAGTKVTILEKAGSYLVVRSDSGVKAYIAAAAVEQEKDIAMDVSAIVSGSNRFALDLYQQLRSEEGNLFFSPTSMSIALAMTHAGAEGQTESEIMKTLHFPEPANELHDRMAALQTLWTTAGKDQGIRLNLANRLWGQKSYDFLPEFLQITREKYGAELARLNFAMSAEARQTINRWIEQQTENKITDLIPPSAISADTKLVLTNAVYFHGAWSEPFEKAATQDEDFFLTKKETIKVPMMRRADEFRYGEIDDLKVLELPYGKGDLSMVILLPNRVDGLAKLEGKLTVPYLQKVMASVNLEDEVKVSLPKFKTASQFQMASTLRKMGMETAFDAKAADFSGMTGGKDLFISEVIHKAFVDVNEEGTEAAAATAVMMAPTAALFEKPKKVPVFRADHPFVFAIQDSRNGGILFLGRMVNPAE